MTDIISAEQIAIAAAIVLVEKAYDDALSPPEKEVGKTLRDVFKAIRLVTLPFQGLAFLQDKIDVFLDRSLAQTDEQNRVMPPGQTILRIYQELTINNLSTQTGLLLSNLMARFIDKTRLDEAHPAFIIIIPQLSNDEINILKFLKNQEVKTVHYSAYNKDKNLFTSQGDKENQYPMSELTYPNNFYLYIGHLYSLNLAGCWQDGNQKLDVVEGVQKGVTINKITRLTDFGRLFVKACL
jgi:hypothetical protein